MKFVSSLSLICNITIYFLRDTYITTLTLKFFFKDIDLFHDM